MTPTTTPRPGALPSLPTAQPSVPNRARAPTSHSTGPQSPVNARSSQPGAYPPVGRNFSLAPMKNDSSSASTKFGSASIPNAVVLMALSVRVPAR